LICDSQVHAPHTPHAGPVPGIEPDALLAEMDRADVARCVVVPMMPPPGNDLALTNQAALRMAARHPDRFAVMGIFDLTDPGNSARLSSWRSQPGMLGVRVAFLRDPNLSLLTEGRLEWFWSAAEAAQVPIMLIAPDHGEEIADVAAAHPRLRLVVDHLNLHPMVSYDDLLPAIQPLLALASHDNVAVKASSLPCWAQDAWPYPSIHRAIETVTQAFGPRRVFWGSDLTRSPVSYRDSIALFTHELPFLSDEELVWIMGRGVMEWLRWAPQEESLPVPTRTLPPANSTR
jgi:predicted TIM-barrel fold metal-dependent hydrolase